SPVHSGGIRSKLPVNVGQPIPNPFRGMAKGQAAADDLRCPPTLFARFITVLVDLSHEIAEMVLVGLSPLISGVRVSPSQSLNHPLDPQRIPDLVTQMLGGSAPRRRDDGKPAGHRLVDRQAPAFTTRREDEAVGGPVQATELLRREIGPNVDDDPTSAIRQPPTFDCRRNI